MRLAVMMLWLALAALLGCERAFAHAALVESHPADGAVVHETPVAVRLQFNEPVSVLVVSLTDSRGQTHRDLTVSAHNEILEIAMPRELPRGSHVLSYRVTSGDGHPIGGSMVFSVGTPTGAATGAGSKADPGVRAALWSARLLLSLGLFVGVGGVFFLAWVSPDLSVGGTERVLAGCLSMGAIAALLSLGLQGLDALGEPLKALATSAPWTAGLRTSFGLTVAIGMAAFFLASFGHRGPARTARAFSLAALIGVGLSLASSGHAGAAAPQWLTRPALFVHAIGIAYWVGALVPLAFVVRKVPRQALSIVRRFSAGALMAVAALMLAGLVLAVIQVESPANLMRTAYGWVLSAKTLLVMGLLGLAAVNRLRLTPALGVPGHTGGTWLVRSVVAEIVLATAILGLVGLWRFTPPPRALAPAAEAAASVSIHLHSPRIMAQVTLSPGLAGTNGAKMVIASGRAEPIAPKEVTLVLSKPDAGIEPLERRARNVGRDGWQVDGLVLPQAGSWQVRIDILIDDFEKATLEGSVTTRK